MNDWYDFVIFFSVKLQVLSFARTEWNRDNHQLKKSNTKKKTRLKSDKYVGCNWKVATIQPNTTELLGKKGNTPTRGHNTSIGLLTKLFFSSFPIRNKYEINCSWSIGARIEEIKWLIVKLSIHRLNDSIERQIFRFDSEEKRNINEVLSRNRNM